MYEWQEQTGPKAAEIPHERDPRNFPWGMFSADDNAQAPIGMFMWFATPDEMAEYVRIVEPQTYQMEADERAELLERLDPGLTMLVADPSGLEKAREAVNSAASGYWETHWWGTFDGLCSGAGEWERFVRDQFHDHEGEVTPDKIDHFIDFLSHYGCQGRSKTDPFAPVEY